MTAATASPPMLLDRLLPEYDALLAEHRVIDGEPEAVFRAVTSTDLAEIPRSNPAVRGLFTVRAGAERVIAALTGRPAPAPAAAEPIRLGDMREQADWVKLGEDPPREFAFGVIGRFWAGETVWKQIDAANFVAYDEPGMAKIACSLSLRPYGSERTLVSYEVRTKALDPDSRTRFLAYWRMVRPGVRIVMRGFLEAVARTTRRTTDAVA